MAAIKQQQLFEQAVSFARNGQFTRAAYLYRSLLTKLPNHPEISLHYAHALGLSGQRIEAGLVHEKLLVANQKAPELHVRMARDREEWQDFEGALKHWDSVAACSNQWQDQARYHRVRLLERCNRVEEARAAWEVVVPKRTEVWGWYWLEGRLEERGGDYMAAKVAFEKGFVVAQGQDRASCAASMARVADRLADYDEALGWIRRLQDERKLEAIRFRKRFPLSKERLEIQVPSVNEPETDGESPLLFLTGFPRAGTTLMAQQLRDRQHVALSEEFPYLRHLVDRQANAAGKLPAIAKLMNGSQAPRGVDEYWEAQQQTVPGFVSGETTLIDKNPSQGGLAPWVLAIFPNARFLWMERDARDLWLSAVMLDAPVNAITCWWTAPFDFGRWLSRQAQLRDRLSAALPSNRFQRVSYEELVENPNSVVDRVANDFELRRSGTHSAVKTVGSVVTSPSYAESVLPVSTDRTSRWRNYRDLLESPHREAFDCLPDRI